MARVLAFVYLQSSCLLAVPRGHFVSVKPGTLDWDIEGVLLKLRTLKPQLEPSDCETAARQRDSGSDSTPGFCLSVLLQPQTSTAVGALQAAAVKVDSHVFKPVLFLLQRACSQTLPPSGRRETA